MQGQELEREILQLTELVEHVTEGIATLQDNAESLEMDVGEELRVAQGDKESLTTQMETMIKQIRVRTVAPSACVTACHAMM